MSFCMYVVPDPKSSPLYSACLFIFCLLSLCLILFPSYHYYLMFTSFFSVYQSKIGSLPFSLSLTTLCRCLHLPLVSPSVPLSVFLATLWHWLFSVCLYVFLCQSLSLPLCPFLSVYLPIYVFPLSVCLSLFLSPSTTPFSLPLSYYVLMFFLHVLPWSL